MATDTGWKLLQSSIGKDIVFQEDGSCNVVFTPQDMAGDPITKLNLISATLTLFDPATNEAINGRLDQDVLDANDGVVDDDGTITVRLDATDMAIIGDVADGEFEDHVLYLDYTWSDGVATRTGRTEPRAMRLVNRPTVTLPT